MSMSNENILLSKVNKQEFLQHLTEHMNCHGISLCNRMPMLTY